MKTLRQVEQADQDIQAQITAFQKRLEKRYKGFTMEAFSVKITLHTQDEYGRDMYSHGFFDIDKKEI